MTRRAMVGLLAGIAAAAVTLAAIAAPPDEDGARLARIQRMYATYRLAFPEVPGVAVDALMRELKQGGDLVLVDVRPREERAVATIPGAISREAFESDPERWRGRRVVVFCTVGARSGAYARALLRQGWDVRNLEGSLLAWTHAGGPLVDEDGRPTRRIHVHGRRWNLAARGYEPVITDREGRIVPLR